MVVTGVTLGASGDAGGTLAAGVAGGFGPPFACSDSGDSGKSAVCVEATTGGEGVKNVDSAEGVAGKAAPSISSGVVKALPASDSRTGFAIIFIAENVGGFCGNPLFFLEIVCAAVLRAALATGTAAGVATGLAADSADAVIGFSTLPSRALVSAAAGNATLRVEKAAALREAASCAWLKRTGGWRSTSAWASSTKMASSTSVRHAGPAGGVATGCANEKINSGRAGRLMARPVSQRTACAASESP